MKCPLCRNHRVGVLSEGRYFCADCSMEIVVKDAQALVYLCDEHGELKLYQELEAEAVRNCLFPLSVPLLQQRS